MISTHWLLSTMGLNQSKRLDNDSKAWTVSLRFEYRVAQLDGIWEQLQIVPILVKGRRITTRALECTMSVGNRCVFLKRTTRQQSFSIREHTIPVNIGTPTIKLLSRLNAVLETANLFDNGQSMEVRLCDQNHLNLIQIAHGLKSEIHSFSS